MKPDKLMGFVSDCAATMIGSRNGVAVKLKNVNKLLISIHCVCHKLALACIDTLSALKYIRTVQDTPRQLWYLFENSPKKHGTLCKSSAELEEHSPQKSK